MDPESYRPFIFAAMNVQIMAPPMADDRLYLVGSALESALVDRWGHLLIEEAPAL